MCGVIASAQAAMNYYRHGGFVHCRCCCCCCCSYRGAGIAAEDLGCRARSARALALSSGRIESFGISAASINNIIFFFRRTGAGS